MYMDAACLYLRGRRCLEARSNGGWISDALGPMALPRIRRVHAAPHAGSVGRPLVITRAPSATINTDNVFSQVNYAVRKQRLVFSQLLIFGEKWLSTSALGPKKNSTPFFFFFLFFFSPLSLIFVFLLLLLYRLTFSSGNC